MKKMGRNFLNLCSGSLMPRQEKSWPRPKFSTVRIQPKNVPMTKFFGNGCSTVISSKKKMSMTARLINIRPVLMPCSNLNASKWKSSILNTIFGNIEKLNPYTKNSALKAGFFFASCRNTKSPCYLSAINSMQLEQSAG